MAAQTADSDGDGVPDATDWCPSEAAAEGSGRRGCPASAASATDPDISEPDEYGRRRRNTGIMIGGIALTSLGGGCAIMGAVGLAFPSTDPDPEDERARKYAFIGLLAGGGAAAIAGIPIFLYGAKRVRPAEPSVARASLRVSMRSVSVAGSF